MRQKKSKRSFNQWLKISSTNSTTTTKKKHYIQNWILHSVCFLFVKYMLTYFQSVVQRSLWKFIASFFVSIMSSYLAFGHSFDWSYHLFHTGMVPFSFLFLLYFFGLTICFSGMVPFSFYSFEFESLEAFVGRYILDIVRQVEISSICRICFYFSSFRYWFQWLQFIQFFINI